MSKMSQFTEIVIADTQLLIVEGLKALLSDCYNITSIAVSKNELLKALRMKAPGILIVDFNMLDFDGYDDLKDIKRKYQELGIIILTNSLNRNELIEYNNVGIKNILHKSLDKEELFECLDALLKGKKYYSGNVLDLMFESNGKKEAIDGTMQLTASEVEIVRLIAEGLTNKEIAVRKFLSIHTIMTHRKNILRKLDVSNASELIMYAIKNGIIDAIEYHI
jgi:DNA-binding NarL/FixJ family response regulator